MLMFLFKKSRDPMPITSTIPKYIYAKNCNDFINLEYWVCITLSKYTYMFLCLFFSLKMSNCACKTLKKAARIFSETCAAFSIVWSPCTTSISGSTIGTSPWTWHTDAYLAIMWALFSMANADGIWERTRQNKNRLINATKAFKMVIGLFSKEWYNT